MAIATVTKTGWGYSVTGDTDATTVATGTIRVKAIGFSGNADNATALITTLSPQAGATAVSAGKFKCSDTTELSSTTGNFMYFGERGVPMENLAVTLGNGGSHLYVYIA